MRRIEDELDVPCRYCGAEPGDNCKGPDGKPKKTGLVHNVRAEDADAKQAADAAYKKGMEVRILKADPEHPGTYDVASTVEAGNTMEAEGGPAAP